MGRSKSSKRWLAEHFDDEFVQRAQREGWRGRAAFKLLEFQEKYQLIKPGMKVVDLGAAPGAWSQVALKAVGEKGQVLGLDILEIEPLHGLVFIQGDFTEDDALEALRETLDGAAVDLVISDMAPNMSGQRAVDQPRSMHLAELAFDFCKEFLGPRGDFVCKLFQGEGIDAFIADVRQAFERVKVMKPKASRAGSREVYLVARNYRL